MQSSVLQGILLPFWGTSLGAACVFCLRRAPSAVLRRVLEGFAAGVMTAASVWSLLLPAIDWADMGRWSFLPAAGGFWLGVLFLRLLERLLPEAVTDRSTTMTLLAVTLHNIPEGFQRSIFQPFFRVDKSRSREYGGVGLGLSLACEIADLHGGSVWVEESSDKGTTIAVELPVQ